VDKEQLYRELQSGIDDLVVQHGVYSLPLISSILTGPGIPAGLRRAALDTVGRFSYPQTADLLARLAASGRIDLDAQADSLYTLARLLEDLNRVHQTQPLLALCREAFSISMLSEDAEIRRAAVSGYAQLTPPGSAVEAAQFLRGLLRSDPSPEVRSIAANVLMHHESWVKDNEWLAGEMKTVVLSPGPESDRVLALNVLVATQTPSARETVLVCLQDGSEGMRKVAIVNAGELLLRDAVPLLARMFADADSVDPGTRRSYVIPALSKIPGLESVRALLACSASDADPELRHVALAAAADAPGIGNARLGDELARLYESCTDPRETNKVERLLARNASPQAYDVLRRAFAAEKDERRLQIASHLLNSLHGGDFVQSSFSELLKTDVGRQAIVVLTKTAPDRALSEVREFYVERKGDGIDFETRRMTIRALGKLGSVQAGILLAKIADIEKGEDLEDEARQALQQIEDQN